MDQLNDVGASALHFSYTRTDSGLRITRDLVGSGANIELHARNGMTPLVAAWQRGDLRKVQCLAALGAQVPEDVNAVGGTLQALVDPADFRLIVDFLQAQERTIPDNIARICSVNR